MMDQSDPCTYYENAVFLTLLLTFTNGSNRFHDDQSDFTYYENVVFLTLLLTFTNGSNRFHDGSE